MIITTIDQDLVAVSEKGSFLLVFLFNICSKLYLKVLTFGGIEMIGTCLFMFHSHSHHNAIQVRQ